MTASLGFNQLPPPLPLCNRYGRFRRITQTRLGPAAPAAPGLHVVGQPALVVDGRRRAIEHGALDVVDADVVVEHRTRIGIVLLDWRAGETGLRPGLVCMAALPC